MCTGTLPLHVHWDVHYLVDELRLRYLCSLLHLPDDGHLSPHDDRHIHGFVDELCPGNFVETLRLLLKLNSTAILTPTVESSRMSNFNVTAIAFTACDHSNERLLVSPYFDRCCNACKDSQRNRHCPDTRLLSSSRDCSALAASRLSGSRCRRPSCSC